MALELLPLAGESVIAAAPVPAQRRRYRFGFVVTSDAVYVPAPKRGLAITEGLKQRRIPNASILRVSMAPAPLVNSHSLLSVAGLVFGSLVLWGFFRGGNYSRWMIAAFAAVYAQPLAQLVMGSPGRYLVTITTRDETLTFGPRFDDVIWRSKKAEALRTQKAFLGACRSAGIPVDPPEAALEPQLP